MLWFDIKNIGLDISCEYHCLFLKWNQTTIDAMDVDATIIDIDKNICVNETRIDKGLSILHLELLKYTKKLIWHNHLYLKKKKVMHLKLLNKTTIYLKQVDATSIDKRLSKMY